MKKKFSFFKILTNRTDSKDWVINFNSDFLGSKSLLDQKKNGVKRKLVAFKMKDKCIPRKGYDIFYKNEKIGIVTSGTFSLSLKVGIGMGYIQSAYSKINSLINLKILFITKITS